MGGNLNQIYWNIRYVAYHSCRCSTNCDNLPSTGKSGRSRTGSGERWTSEFVKNEACLEEGNCPISTSLSIIPPPDKYVPQNGPTLLPLECLGVAGLAVERVGPEFCGRWGLLRGGELLLIPASLPILFSVWWIYEGCSKWIAYFYLETSNFKLAQKYSFHALEVLPMARNAKFQLMYPLLEGVTVRWFGHSNKVLMNGRSKCLLGLVFPPSKECFQFRKQKEITWGKVWGIRGVRQNSYFFFLQKRHNYCGGMSWGIVM